VDSSSTNLGGISISASLADSQNQINQILGTNSTLSSDTISQFATSYRASGSGPILKLIGYNPFQLFVSGNFHLLYWSTITLFLSIICVLALHRSISARTTAAIKHPLSHIGTVYFRLLVGVLIIANTPLIYGFLMTINLTLSRGVESIATDYMNGIVQSTNLGTLTFAQARTEAIRSACARRAIALYPSDITKDEMLDIGNFYNAVAQSINSQITKQTSFNSLPLLDLNYAKTIQDESQCISFIGRFVIQNFPSLVAALGSIDPSQSKLIIAFPSNTTTELPLLSLSLQADDNYGANAVSTSYYGSSSESFENARKYYQKQVLTDTIKYLDTSFLSVIRSSPTLSQKLSGWFSEHVEQAAIAANNFMEKWRSIIDWSSRGIGIILTRIVSFIFSMGVTAFIEIELFVLTLAVPFWLLPTTEDAFYGVLKSLSSLCIIVPAYQFIMLFIDGLMGLILRYLLLGPAASNGTGLTGNIVGSGYSGALIIATISSDGEIIILIMVCYLIAYLFLSIYIAIKTPKLILSFIKGAGIAGEIISNFTTGIIAGASTALVTASVSGSSNSLSKRLIFGSKTQGVPNYKTATKPRINKTRSNTTQSVSSTDTSSNYDRATSGDNKSKGYPHAFNYKTAAIFGTKTFIENLGSDSALEAISNSIKAAELHTKKSAKDNLQKNP
jgi:hypothetical protein